MSILLVRVMALRASYSRFLLLHSLDFSSMGFGFRVGLNTRRRKGREI